MEPFDILPEHIRRITLQPGDTLVLKVDGSLTADELGVYSRSLNAAFPNHRTVVLDGDCDLEVLSPPPTG